MATREVAIPETVSHMKFILAVVDGCIESEGAVIELLGIGSLPENIHMFYAHRKPIHEKSIGLPLWHLHVTLRYLEDMLGLDASISREYEEYCEAGRHVLLVNVYRESEAKTVSSILGRAQPRAGRILGYGHTAKLQALTD